MDDAKSNTNSNLKTILDESLDLSLNQIRRLLSNMSSSEIAHALESSPPKQRNILFSLLKGKKFLFRKSLNYILEELMFLLNL